LEAVDGRTRRWKLVSPYVWVVPVFAVLGAVFAYPWGWSLWLSFHTWNVAVDDAPTWVGLKNYVDIVRDRSFWLALQNSVFLIVASVVAQTALGLAYAVLLDSGVRARQLFLTIVMLPFVLAPVMVGLTWKILLQDQFGLLNYYLRRLGLGAPQWLSDPSFTMITIIGLEIWQYTPFVVLILYAGLQAIPGEIRESARVDGASALQMFRFITVPHLMSLILIVVLFRVIFALRTFDVVYTLFKAGGPGNAGMVLGVYLYEELKVSWELGKASAISYVILILTVLLSASLTWRTMRAEPR
jgi:multiple sugar transport system permease protein